MLENAVKLTAESIDSEPDINHCRVWAALVISVASVTVHAELQTAQATLQAHMLSNPEQWRPYIHHCRVSPTYDNKRIKVQYWVDSPLDAVAAAIAQILISTGGEQMFGSPPRSAKERKAASLLMTLNKR
ncbi:unnamed protein product [Polarella glacialis]|uniref:Uncharacterized protein n=1 Tax=Polarella glacialis TaxID=89957 RepID=A0A813HHC5_POLGL|nr:unnamed protein product [Polarella glacialis]